MTVLPYDDPNAYLINNNIVVSEMDAVQDAPPVEPVSPAAAPQPADPIGVRDEVDNTPVDLAQVSREARVLSRDQISREAADDPAAYPIAAYYDSLNSRSVRELLATFNNYDNRIAVSNYNNYLNMFTSYGPTLGGAEREENAEQTLRGLENELYRYMGVSNYGSVTRDMREGISRAIDRWFIGEGVFTPQMLNYSSGDGFRFSPVSPEAELALRYRDVLSSYDRQQIASYLREMALLRPRDFLFYDPTGLENMSLEERRAFLAEMDRLLTQAGANARAADLQYRPNADGSLDIDYVERQLADDRQRLADLLNAQRDAYGQMLNLYQRYGLATISAMLA